MSVKRVQLQRWGGIKMTTAKKLEKPILSAYCLFVIILYNLGLYFYIQDNCIEYRLLVNN